MLPHNCRNLRQGTGTRQFPLDGNEQVSEVALAVLCAEWPPHAGAIVFGKGDPWRGRHWSGRLHLMASGMLREQFPAEAFRDVRRLVKQNRLPATETVSALRLLAKWGPRDFIEVVEFLLASKDPAPVGAVGCELLYRAEPKSARSVALQGLAAASPRLRERVASVLRADSGASVTEALIRRMEVEESSYVRAELARALVVPGCDVPSPGLRNLSMHEDDVEVRAILDLASSGAEQSQPA